MKIFTNQKLGFNTKQNMFFIDDLIGYNKSLKYCSNLIYFNLF